MKQCIKYFIFGLLAVLLLNNTLQAVAAVSVPAKSQYTCNFVSQAETTRHAIQHIYMHFSLVSPCLEQTDVTQVPDSKFTLLPFDCTQRGPSTMMANRQSTPHPMTHSVLDPHCYYIFGLKRIVI